MERFQGDGIEDLHKWIFFLFANNLQHMILFILL